MAGGRPAKFKPEYIEQAKKYCEKGATDQEVAEFFNVSVRTIYRWKLEHDEFCHALTVGKEAADQRVVATLYKKCVGYTLFTDQVVKTKTPKGGERSRTVKVGRDIEPDTAAIKYWLSNRDPENWADKKQISGPNGGPIEVDAGSAVDKLANFLGSKDEPKSG